MKYSLLFLLFFYSRSLAAQTSTTLKPIVKGTPLADQVNVFLGSSGDLCQLSPAASYPFSMLSIGPQPYPATHTGYEHLAKEFLGFTHNRMEGVRCLGSGGNLLIKPFPGEDPEASTLLKAAEDIGPVFYQVSFKIRSTIPWLPCV